MNSNIIWTDDQKQLLASLASGVLPLKEWIEKHNYKPEDNDSWIETQDGFPERGPPPWRNADITPFDLGALDVIESLIRESDNTPARHHRWRDIVAEDFKHCPIPNRDLWRAARGLDVNMTFGIAESGNTPMDTDNKPLLRHVFYGDFLAALQEIIDKESPVTETDWRRLADELWADQCKNWPVKATRRSSTFIRQFARDLLVGTMGMINHPIKTDSPLWKYAVLIEMGEHRRAGSGYTTEHVKTTVQRFDNFMDSFKKGNP